jgi:hypothetical protein
VSDELLRKLERGVAADGSAAARIRLASELERRARPADACAVLFEALAVFPANQEVRLALGRFRGPGAEWSQPQSDARNTRRSPAKGPRGEGKVLERRLLAPIVATSFARTQDQRVDTPSPVPPPLVVGSYVYSSLATGRRIVAATADGHAIDENFGASGFEWSANRDGKIAWRIAMRVDTALEHEANPDKWCDPLAVVAPDATVFGVTALRRLIAIEPSGGLRFQHSVPAKVTSLALDFERGKLHLLYSHPVGLSTRDLATGNETAWVSLERISTADEAIVCDDGRVACISVWGWVAVVGPSGDLEHEFRFAEKIGGAYGGLTPWGELVVVSFDVGARVSLFDPASGARRGGFEAPDCRGAPAIDSTGTVYLDGGARYVAGFDIISGQPRYHVDRPTLWRTPDQPMSQLALREGELAFVEIAPEGVVLIRVGSEPQPAQ